jgi:hypothetical protein
MKTYLILLLLLIILSLCIPLFFVLRPNVSTGEPVIFGPPVWKSLHIMAENYPTQPNQKHQTNCVKFVSALPYMLPCSDCGSHLLKEEQAIQNLPAVCSSRSNLRSFFVEAHNNVNKHLGKPLWNVKEAENRYKTERSWKDVSRVWGEDN